MKWLYVFGLVACLSACGSKKEENNHAICCGGNPSEMVFKTKAGREVVKWEQVTSVEIAIYAATPADPAKPQIYKTMCGDKGRALLETFRLAFPVVTDTTRFPESGMILLHYKDPVYGTEPKSHTLIIKGAAYLQDPNFPDVIYKPDPDLTREWAEPLIGSTSCPEKPTLN